MAAENITSGIEKIALPIHQPKTLQMYTTFNTNDGMYTTINMFWIIQDQDPSNPIRALLIYNNCNCCLAPILFRERGKDRQG